MGYNGITVLVVEDEVLLRMDIAQSLEDEGSEYLRRPTRMTQSPF